MKMFHFTAWPDKGVPKKYDEFVTFLEDSREHGKQSDTPIIVHCSAGVGRTGARLTRETLFQVSVPIFRHPYLATDPKSFRKATSAPRYTIWGGGGVRATKKSNFFGQNFPKSA